MENKPQLKDLNFIKRKDWLILAAVILLCAAVAVWSFAGIIQTTVTATGVSFTTPAYGDYVVVAIGGKNIDKVEAGKTAARIVPDWAEGDMDNYISGTVSYISSQPMSAEDVNVMIENNESGIKTNNIGEQIIGDNSHRYVGVIQIDRDHGKYVFNNGDTLEEFPENTICEVTVMLDESHPYEIVTRGGQ